VGCAHIYNNTTLELDCSQQQGCCKGRRALHPPVTACAAMVKAVLVCTPMRTRRPLNTMPPPPPSPSAATSSLAWLFCSSSGGQLASSSAWWQELGKGGLSHVGACRQPAAS
jgi:hypothetical protein